MLRPRERGNILVITGPSGVGKGTIVAQILNKHSDIVLSVSATTRKIRPGEKDGVNYHFKTAEEFRKLIDSGQMLEWAIFADNYYGTFKEAVEKEIYNGKDVILEIEVQGAMQIKEKLPEASLIFIAPPSLSDLKSRLQGRATESEDVIAKRVSIAEKELNMIDKFDYKVVNDDLNTAIRDLENIIMDIRKLKG